MSGIFVLNMTLISCSHTHMQHRMSQELMVCPRVHGLLSVNITAELRVNAQMCGDALMRRVSLSHLR